MRWTSVASTRTALHHATALPLRTTDKPSLARCHDLSIRACARQTRSRRSPVCSSPARLCNRRPQRTLADCIDDTDVMADTKSNASMTSSGKRKRSTPLAFYAVKVGLKPGVYQTWDEANQQIQGFKNPVYRKFRTYTEAEAMIKGATTTPTSKSGKTKYYGVAVGHVPGVYTDYSTVQAQTKGCVGAKQKGFSTQLEAQAYVDEFRRDKSAPISLRGDLSEASSLTTAKGCKASDNAAKKQKKNNNARNPALPNGNVELEPGYGLLPPDAEDGFDRTIKLDVDNGTIRYKTADELAATKLQPTADPRSPIVVYTDGSSLGNGRANAVAGVGVYFGPNDTRNISEPLRGPRQTNQRAELTAVARALDHIPLDRATRIVTDSNYAIKCLTEWFSKWEANHWRNSVGREVENKDLIQPIIARIRERERCKAETRFEWVKGHANDPGNVAADGLAVLGSRGSTPGARAAREVSETLNGGRVRSPFFGKREGHVGPPRERDGGSADDINAADDIEEIFANLAAEQNAADSALGEEAFSPVRDRDIASAKKEDAGHTHPGASNP